MKFLKKEFLVRCPHSDMISTLSNEGLVHIQVWWPIFGLVGTNIPSLGPNL
jgi:hypothetical protein